MYFTQEDYKKIEAWLAQRTVKDTDFPKACPIDGTEEIPIIQKEKNKRIKFNDFLKKVIEKSPSDFYNVHSEINKDCFLSLEEAISYIPESKRELGLVITFKNSRGNWLIYQFKGASLNQFYSTDCWASILQEALEEFVFWPDEEDITFVRDGNRNLLKFKNREYNPEEFLGKGMIILRRNYEGVACNCEEECVCEEDEDKLINVLTQDMISQPNTVYVVEYDFDLKGESIVVPQNSVLWFQGGSINNGSLYLNETAILGAFEFADMGNALLFGTFNKGQIMTFYNKEYKKKEGNYFTASVKSSSASKEEDTNQDTEVTYIENTAAYVTSPRQELRWWNGEEWILILDITDYQEIKSIINNLIEKHNAEMSACYKYFKARCFTLEKKIVNIEGDITNIINKIEEITITINNIKQEVGDFDELEKRVSSLEAYMASIHCEHIEVPVSVSDEVLSFPITAKNIKGSIENFDLEVYDPDGNSDNFDIIIK